MSTMRKVPGYKYLYQRGKGGTLYFRRSVPPYARHLFGGRLELEKSLDTTVLAEARFKWSELAAEFDTILKRAKLQPVAPDALRQNSAPSIIELEEAVREFFAARRARSSFERLVVPGMAEQAKRTEADLRAVVGDSEYQIPATVEGSSLAAEWIAETLMEKHGWQLDEQSPSYGRLLNLLERSRIEAARQEIAEIHGKPIITTDPIFSDDEFAKDEQRRGEEQKSAPLNVLDIFDAYIAERKPRTKTADTWRAQLEKFLKFAKNIDARQLKQADVIRWKDHLVSEQKLNPNTINDGYLAALKTTLNWAVGNGILENNVAECVRARSQPKQVVRELGLTDDEARLILTRTFMPPPPRLSSERAFALRWVPWLCAFSGARVNEITQMRAEDISLVNGIWTMTITPEAGSVKTNKRRIVPIHPQLIEQGFVEAIRGKTGPLFYDPARKLKDTAEVTQASKTGEFLAKWVRDIGVTDKRVQPNHGWRHRFKTVARRVGMDAEVRDTIQGHRHRTEGEAYGDTDVEVLNKAICMLPSISIDLIH